MKGLTKEFYFEAAFVMYLFCKIGMCNIQVYTFICTSFAFTETYQFTEPNSSWDFWRSLLAVTNNNNNSILHHCILLVEN